MARRFCRECGNPVAPEFKICPKCGKTLEPSKPKPDFRASPPAGVHSRQAGYPQRERYEQPLRGGYRERQPGAENYGERYDQPLRGSTDIYRERQNRAGNYSGRYDQPLRGSADIYRERQDRADNYGGRYEQPLRGSADMYRGGNESYSYGSYEQPLRGSGDIYRERQDRAGSYGGRYEAPAYEESPVTGGYADSYADGYADGYADDGYADDGYGYEDEYYEPEPPAPRHSSKSTGKSRKKSGGKLAKFVSTSSKVVRTVIQTIKIAVLLSVIYLGIFLIEVYRVKLTPYPYSTTMRLSSTNYGQAISGYFSSGHWTVNPFTAKCSYKGETHHSEEMELVFSAGLKVELSGITIDGEPIDSKLFESKIMGMFI